VLGHDDLLVSRASGGFGREMLRLQDAAAYSSPLEKPHDTRFDVRRCAFIACSGRCVAGQKPRRSRCEHGPFKHPCVVTMIARPVLRSGYALIHDDAVIGNPSMLIG